MTGGESFAADELSKLALNVCLMATACGVRCLGPANPLPKRHSSHDHKPVREMGKADPEVPVVPMQYAFSQEVTLYRRETEDFHVPDGKHGWTCRPHWRRGHWRSQPCGPGQQRLVVVPPVLVNAHHAYDPPTTDSRRPAEPPPHPQPSTVSTEGADGPTPR